MRWVPALFALLVAGACSSGGGGETEPPTTPATLDIAQATTQIEAYVAATYPTVARGAVTCPDSVEVEQGSTFQCTAVVGDGKELHITVTQDSADGTEISFVPDEAVIEMATVVANLPGQVADKFTGGATVDRGPDQVMVIPPGGTFGCSGTDITGTAKIIQVTVTDINGNLSVAVL
jgi:hypothetical protein